MNYFDRRFCYFYFYKYRYITEPTIRIYFQNFIFQLMHITLKNVELLKHFKIRKLLQHVSVYRETIMREPQTVLS